MKHENGVATQEIKSDNDDNTRMTSRKKTDSIKSAKNDSLTSSQRQLLFIICVTRFLNQIASFWGSICVPIEAHRRNVSSLTVGILTATETAISWVTSIYISASFTKFGQEKAAERLLMFGIVSHSISIIFVSVTELSSSMFAFVILFATSYACSGVGLACSMTSINALIIAHFDNSQITQAKSIETISYTLGTVLAFVVAGVLYMFGGLPTVVITVGSIELIWGILCCFWLPAILPKLQRTLTLERSLRNLRASQEIDTKKPPREPKEPKESWGFLMSLMSVSEIRFILVNHFMRYMTLAFNQPILSNRLESFGLAPPMIGVVVALAYIAIAVVAVPYKILGSSPRRIKMILVGSLVVFFPIPALMGPIQFVQDLFSVEPNPWLLSATLTTAGILLAPGLVLDQLAVTEAGEKAGLFPRERNVAISGAIGGILASFEFLGLFLGPPIGGACKDYFNSFEDGIFYGGFITTTFGYLWLICSLISYAKEKFLFRKKLEELSDLPDTAV